MNYIEKEIVTKIFEELKRIDWYLVKIDDGEISTYCDSLSLALPFLDSLEFAHLYFRKQKAEKIVKSWVLLIFNNGNNGIDLIADHSVSERDFRDVIDDVSNWSSDLDWVEFLMNKLEEKKE